MKKSNARLASRSGGELPREMTPLDSLMINVGVMIASAIFLVPASVACEVETAWLMLAVWVVAGLLLGYRGISFGSGEESWRLLRVELKIQSAPHKAFGL